MGEPEFEFFGPHGPAVLLVVLPALCLGLYFGCNAHECLQLWPTLHLPRLNYEFTLFTLQGLFSWIAWLLFIAALHLLLPSHQAQGVTLPDGKKLTYRLNGLYILFIIYGGALWGGFFTDQINLGWVYDHYLQLLSASILVSFALALYLYLASFQGTRQLVEAGTSGYPAYDFWMGRELNPRISILDLKEFCELYPGMIGWVILNLGMAHKQWKKLGYITNSMYMVNAFELIYVFDALWNEKSILTTMDITTDGFGFMLVFGDLTWVPFLFSLQAKFLVDYPQDLSAASVVAILALNFLGLYIFRGANGQKDLFRRDPNHPAVQHLKTIPTERGTKLIVSGWWGVARHINYFGDWLMGVSWCLPTGLPGMKAVVPYFYAIYFATLLVHRELRDEHACKKKYGKDYDKYCSIVKYRIVPYVY